MISHFKMILQENSHPTETETNISRHWVPMRGYYRTKACLLLLAEERYCKALRHSCKPWCYSPVVWPTYLQPVSLKPPTALDPQGPPEAFHEIRTHFQQSRITSLTINICSLEIHKNFFKAVTAGRYDLTDLVISGAQKLILGEDALNFGHQRRYFAWASKIEIVDMQDGPSD